MLSCLAAALLLLTLCAPAAFAIRTGTYYVDTNTGTGGNLLLKAQPDIDAPVLASIPYGTKLQITKISDNGAWAYTSYNRRSGWVMAKFLTPNEPGPSKIERKETGDRIADLNVEFNSMAQNKLDKPYQVRVHPPKLSSRVNLRWAPSEHALVMRNDLVYGDILTVTAEGSGWLQVIDAKTGLAGYIIKGVTDRLE